MTRAAYDLIFEISTLDEELEDSLYEHLDVQVSTIAGVHLVTVTAEGSSGFAAAMTVVAQLCRLGAQVVRSVEDLVGRGEIARRAKVTRQAVGNWLRGERQVGSNAPLPYVVAEGAELWLWGEVRDWLSSIGQIVDQGVAFPNRVDHQMINGLLAIPSGWSASFALSTSTKTRVLGSVGEVSLHQTVVRASQQNFKLAA